MKAIKRLYTGWRLISKRIKPEYIFISALVILALFGVKALFKPGFYTSHDGRHQVVRLRHFHQGLSEGQFPVRWAGNALYGYGYPLFVFTYRFPFWLGEAYYLLFGSLTNAIKFVFIITHVFSGLSMYWFAREYWKSKLSGFLSAFLYLWAPYRFLDIFVRASLGEAVTFVFIPLIFLGILQLSKELEKRHLWIMLTSFSLAGVILSHAMFLGLWFFPLLIFFIINFISSPIKKRFFLSSSLAGIIGLFLTAYYWIPAALERKYISVFGALGDYYKAHFVTLRQLLYSKWGYGFSLPGVENDMMSFQVGFAQWLVLLVSLFFLFKKRVKKQTIFIWQIIFLISIFLMTKNAVWVYEKTNKFFTIDIPWRFLGVTVFASSILFGGIVKYFRMKLFKLGFIFFLFCLAFYSNRNHLRVNKYIFYPDEEYWQTEETSNEYNDYMPRWFSLSALKDERRELITITGESDNNFIQRKSNLFEFKSQVNSVQAVIAAKLVYYPGWQVFVDGEKADISYKDDGRIRVTLDRGRHLVKLVFKETKLRKTCNWLSALTLLSLITVFLMSQKEKLWQKRKKSL